MSTFSFIYRTVIFILSSILLTIPVTLALKGFYSLFSKNDSQSWLKDLFQTHSIKLLLADLVQSEDDTIILAISLFLAITFITILFKSRIKSHELKYISGPKLYKGQKAIRHAQNAHREELKTNKLTKAGINIHPKIKITEAREQNNFLILGTTGSGKSTAFKPLVHQAINRGDYSVIYDEKGEYTDNFYRKSNSILIAPWDKRSAKWNICEDIRTKQDAELLALCLIPDSKTPDPIWDQGARVILVSMLMKLINENGQKWNWRDLYKLFTFSIDKAQSEFIVHYPIVKSFIENDSKTTQGFYVHIMSKLSWIEDLAKAWSGQDKSPFSLKRWIKDTNAKCVIIIQADSKYPSLGEPLCNAIISFMTKNYLSETPPTERKTWLFIDEFANLPRNPNIKKWLELARENGARSVICTQSISQLTELYGKDETDSIINLLSNIIVFRMGSAGNDANYCSSIFGEYTAEVPNYDHPNRIGTRAEVPLIKATELTQLKQPSKKGVEGYMILPGRNAAYKLCWPLFHRIKKAKRKIPAAWTKKAVIKNTQQQNRLNKRK